jgi:hypothetical protein
MNATALRPRWTALPGSLRALIADRLGAQIMQSADQSGGFTPGVAARLTLDDGTRVFAKAIPADDVLTLDYLTEAWIAARLPSYVPAPRFRFSLRAAGWIALVFDDVEGRHPDVANPVDLRAVLTTVKRLADVLTPSPVPAALPAGRSLEPLMYGWRGFAEHGPPRDLGPWSLRNLDRLAALEAGWADAVAGSSLLHADLRPDNMLLTRDGRILVVDWACACVGAPWVDLVVLLGSIAGVDAEAILRSHPVTRNVDPAAIDAFLCGLLGCWEKESRGPELPSSPHLRRFQARNADVTRAWLARRTGWS